MHYADRKDKKEHLAHSFAKDIGIKDIVKDSAVDNVLYTKVIDTGQWSEP
jgi:hypothetical protein